MESHTNTDFLTKKVYQSRTLQGLLGVLVSGLMLKYGYEISPEIIESGIVEIVGIVSLIYSAYGRYDATTIIKH